MDISRLKIVSGAQTGVDQGALHAAIDYQLDYGGWVPKGWRTENGSVPFMFRDYLKEHASSNYLGRTKRNVVDSDATLILSCLLPITSGTLKTRIFCQELQKPFIVLQLGDNESKEKCVNWLVNQMNSKDGQFVLNVAGPRESKQRGIQKKTRQFLHDVFEDLFR